jgi:hypothetical protein
VIRGSVGKVVGPGKILAALAALAALALLDRSLCPSSPYDGGRDHRGAQIDPVSGTEEIFVRRTPAVKSVLRTVTSFRRTEWRWHRCIQIVSKGTIDHLAIQLRRVRSTNVNNPFSLLPSPFSFE